MNKKKTIVVCIISLLLIIGAIVGVIVFGELLPSQAFTTTERVVVEEGVPSHISSIREFKVKHDGKYYFDLDLKNDPGMLSGINITDSTGLSIYACTAEWVQIQSGSLELKEGIYEIEIFHITNEKLWKDFHQNYELVAQGNAESYELPYVFAQNGEFETTYHFSLKLERSSFIGIMLLAIAAGIVLTALMLAFTKKGDSTKNQFDERQEIVRGKGFKLGFFTILISNLLFIVMKSLDVVLFSEMEVAMFISIIAGAAVYVCYCIWNDGYFALNENKKSLMIVFCLMGVSNLLLGVGNIISGDAVVDGAFTFRSINLFCAILFMIIFVTLLIKRLMDGKEE